MQANYNWKYANIQHTSNDQLQHWTGFTRNRGKIWCVHTFSTVANLGNGYFDVGKYLTFNTFTFYQKYGWEVNWCFWCAIACHHWILTGIMCERVFNFRRKQHPATIHFNLGLNNQLTDRWVNFEWNAMKCKRERNTYTWTIRMEMFSIRHICEVCA